MANAKIRPNEDKKMLQHEIHDEMKNSYIDYAMSVIVGRALPDVRDGLKPVHRRILYGMSGLGVAPDKPHKKSARIVGEVMGKYHPHGDSSIYDAMVKMAQPFATRYPLVDGHGNFGSIDGDGAAAMRYTEARMTAFALQMLRDIEKDTVDFVPNFDEEEKEPVVLPSRVPNLLINGSNGIAVGMATSIPPHNLGETINAAVKLIDKPEASIKELMRSIKGPDFPTGAQILGKEGIEQAYTTGQGKIQVRAVTEIESLPRGKSQIVVTEIPFQINKARMLEKIGELVRDKKIEGISEIRDESNRQGLRIVIELKKDTDPKVTLNKLYKMSQLQDTFSMIMLALVDGRPRILNLKEILEEFLKHQKAVVTRRTQYDLAKAEARAHILEGLRIALKNLDEVIKTIRASHDDAKQKLMKKFKLTDIQAQAILDLRLARLQGLERKKIEEEYKEVCKKIKYYKKLLKDETMLMGVIREELLEIKKKWGDKRRTKIVSDEEEIAIEPEDLVEDRPVVITMTSKGYLKRIPASKVNRGQEEAITTTAKDDFVRTVIHCSSLDEILLFTNIGKMYRIKAFDIPEVSKAAKGLPAVNLTGIAKKESIVAMIPDGKVKGKKYLVAVTKNGVIKKTEIQEYSSNRNSGIAAITLKDRDEVVSIRQTTGKDTIFLATKGGKGICFSEEEVRPMGRMAAGVKGIALEGKDSVVSMLTVKKSDTIMLVTEKGIAKRTKIAEFKEQGRGGKGLLTYDKAKMKRAGSIAGCEVANDGDTIFLTTTGSKIAKIHANDIEITPRAASGNSVIKPGKGAKVTSISKLSQDELEKAPGKKKSTSEARPASSKKPTGKKNPEKDPAAKEGKQSRKKAEKPKEDARQKKKKAKPGEEDEEIEGQISIADLLVGPKKKKGKS